MTKQSPHGSITKSDMVNRVTERYVRNGHGRAQNRVVGVKAVIVKIYSNMEWSCLVGWTGHPRGQDECIQIGVNHLIIA